MNSVNLLYPSIQQHYCTVWFVFCLKSNVIRKNTSFHYKNVPRHRWIYLQSFLGVSLTLHPRIFLYLMQNLTVMEEKENQLYIQTLFLGH